MTTPPAQPIPARFLPAYQAIQRLEQDARYQGAFIFGSLARGETTKQSDCDVIAIADEDNPCQQINHPIMGGVKLDLTFRSLEQVHAMEQHIVEKRERIPMLAESLIVFDKTGELQRLREQLLQIRPHPVPPAKYLNIQFLIYHENNKVERNLQDDPTTALYAMHDGIYEVLIHHYQLQGHWLVSSKRLLKDLRTWDLALARTIERFVATSELQPKFQLWSTIIDHVLAPLGGRMPIEENNCTCEVCSRDLSVLLGEK
jgi:predicted nucleotidyltransferase